MDVEESLSQVTMPFFILHGEADTVTDPEVSRALYERAASGDKTIKLYPGMWHGLTAGEPDDNVELVFSDIVAWLNDRSHGHRSVQQDLARTPPAPDKVARPDSCDGAADSPAARRRGGFLCGLASRAHHQQCRM
ncbi:hypothetical protein GUJ93_ZPchr0010g7569 [Zizania palustris]|nr:hypothetical protein GUJ93_ZPchr0010g7569 [Zizania palustris]